MHWAHYGAYCGYCRAAYGFGYPEIGYLDHVVLCKHYILGFNVPVHDLLAVRFFERKCYLPWYRHHQFLIYRAFFVYQVLEVFSVNVFHHYIWNILILANIVYVYYVLLIKAGRWLCLILEFFDEFLILAKFRLEHLYGYYPVEKPASGLVYIGHTALSYFFEYFISVS